MGIVRCVSKTSALALALAFTACDDTGGGGDGGGDGSTTGDQATGSPSASGGPSGGTGAAESGSSPGSSGGVTSESSGDPTGADDSTGGSTGEEPEEEVYACTFEARPLSWSVPTLVQGGQDLNEQVADTHGCNSNQQFRYQVLDLSGDGAPDYVVTDLCDAAGVGDTHWEVYENTGDGFSMAPIEWAIPQIIQGAQDIHETTADVITCGSGIHYRYQLLDLTGDGAVDFLVTDACDPAGVGDTHWEVYENTGGGFSMTPTEWALPQILQGGEDLHEQLADTHTCGNGIHYRYMLMDLSGDGAVDYLLTDSCDAEGVGTTTWHVHENTGEGFAETATEWELPQILQGGQDLYEQLADTHGCNTNQQFRYQVLDLTGDGATDLLITDLCDPADVGDDEWQLYAATCDR